MGIADFIEQAQEMQKNMDRCAVCKRVLPPGTAVNKLYDDKMGSLTVCADCSIKAIVWYVRRLYSSESAAITK